MSAIIINNAQVVNEGRIFKANILVNNQRIEKISENPIEFAGAKTINAEGKYLLPGIIDDQVHFREPGLTHKAEIYTEAKAAVSGGITTFMEMPNTVPQALTQELLQDKYDRAEQVSLANYSFFMGASNNNLEEVLKTDKNNVCGVKIFMGSSTGDMLVDEEEVLESIFSNCDMLIATHCEDEATVRANAAAAKEKYGEEVPFDQHPIIRSEEACYLSSSKAVALAKKHDTRLHILHISTAKELELFDNTTPLKEKRITAEACIHHLWFNDEDYKEKGVWIKWNPAVKKESDRAAILQGVLDNKIDIIATDHAPHTIEEKENNSYFKAPSGGPLVQHALNAMLEHYKKGNITLEKLVEKMCHAPADIFQVKDRGYVKEGFYADLVLVDLNDSWEVNKGNVLSKCGWSPFEGYTFNSKVTHTIVSGHLAYENGNFNESIKGQRITFDR